MNAKADSFARARANINGRTARFWGLAASLLAIVLIPALSEAVTWIRKVGTSGNTKESVQRKIVSNQWGFWAFYAKGGSGAFDPVWSYSKSGDQGTWTTPQSIFDGTGYTGFTNKPSVWYHAGSSQVFVVNGSEVSDGDIFLRRGSLDSAGGLTWADNHQTHNPNCVGANTKLLLADPAISIAVDVDTIPWITSVVVDEGDLNAGEDGLVFFASGTAANTVTMSRTNNFVDGGFTCGLAANDAILTSINFVVPTTGTAASKVWLGGYDNGDGIPGVYHQSRTGAPNATVLHTSAHQDGTGNAGGSDFDKNSSAVMDASGNLHWIYAAATDASAPATTEKQLIYRRCTSGGGCGSVHIASTDAVKNVSIGVALSSSPKIVDRLVIVYVQDATGDAFSLTATTGVTTTAGWKREFLGSGYSHMNLAYSVRQPRPLPYVFTKGGDVYMDWIATSAFANPGISAITITSAPTTAPYTANPWTITVTGGTGFQKVDFDDGLGLQEPRLFFFKNGAFQDDLIVSGVAWLSATSFSANLRIVPPVQGGCYDMLYVNADGRNARRLNALCLPAPTKTFWWDPDPGDDKISSMGFMATDATAGFTRNITVQGTGFQNWGGTSTVNLGVYSGASLAAGISISTISNIVEGPETAVFSPR